ncbi:helix-turn-helix domain-containing protein [Faecalimonas sp.]
MSEFSERCRQLLINSGSNVYQMAKHSSLDKTSIQRMVTGKRLPSLDFVKEFCSYLRISPIEKKELLELYEIEKVGKSEYMSRCYIKSLIENLSFLDEDDTENISFSETLEYCETFPPMPNVESKILFVLQSELKIDKNPEILFNLPTSYRYIFFILKGLFAEFEGEASVKHLITLNKNPLNTIYPCQNLEALSNILPLSEILKNIYLPYYLYNNLTLGDEKMLIMPYYIITSKYLLTISSDFKTVSLHDSDTVIRVYRKEFYRIFNMAQPLIKYADNTFKIINHLQENYIEYGLPSHTLEFHPCLFFMDTSFALSKESFKQIPHADEHIAALQEMYKVVSASTPPQNKSGDYNFFLFRAGLRDVLSNGKMFWTI